MEWKHAQQQQAERERRALRWVEHLLEPALPDSQLIEAAQHLACSHYSDVVEERTIEGLCGYPCCGERLGPMPRQRYHVSLERRQVLDLTERKKYCSNECYRASKYFASQLSSLPIWVRGAQCSPIKLLPPASATRCGQMTSPLHVLPHSPHSAPQGTSTSLQKSSNRISKPAKEQDELERDHPSTEEQGELERGHPSTEEQGELERDHPSTEEQDELERDHPSTEEQDELERGHPSTEKQKQGELERDHPSTEQRIHVEPPRLSDCGRLLRVFSGWCTPATWELLSTGGVGREVGGESLVGGEKVLFLPPVHSVSQSQIQRSIFMQQLKKNLPPVAASLGLSPTQTLAPLTALARTFRLDRHTVTFRPGEWRVILLVLLQRLHPDRDLPSLHPSLTKQWLAALGASQDDLRVMLNSLQPPD